MVNKEKLLLIAAIYMLLPGALPDAQAENSQIGKQKGRKAPSVQKLNSAKSSKQAPGASLKAAARKA